MSIDRRIGLYALLVAMTAVVGLGESLPNNAGSAASSNGNPSIPAKSPLVIKGLYGQRSASGTHAADVDPTASAVIRGLRWLQHSQNEDGSWGTNELDAVTGVALLAFLGRGETPASQEFGTTVERAMKFLLADMQPTNSLARRAQPPAFGHAVSTWAICEAYSMTQIPMIKPVAEGALSVILQGQRRSGLWDASYRTDDGGDDIDISVWQVVALRNGLMMGSQAVGLRESLGKASEAMKRVIEAKPDAGTTVGAVLCLQLCGEARSPTCRTGLAALAAMTPDWADTSFPDPMARWYVASASFFHQGGRQWARWNRLLFPLLVKHQVVSMGSQGQEVGCWDPPGGGERFGRAYSTAVSVMMLELTRARSLAAHRPTIEQELTPVVDDKDIVVRFD